MSVIIAGTGRSGTTWLAKIINFDETWQYTFEPLHPNKKDMTDLFGRRKYLRADCINIRYTEPLRKIFGGKNKLVKTVRAHLMLPWIYKNIRDCKIIYLLRHPCAVAWSWMDRNWDAIMPLNEIWAQEDLLSDYPLIQEVKNKVEGNIGNWEIFDKQVLLWCIENYVPISVFSRQSSVNNIIEVIYEDLVKEPKLWIDLIFGFIGRKYDDRVFEVFKIPSPTCRKGSAVLTGEDKINAWKFHVSEEQKEKAFELVRLFGMGSIFSS